MSVIDEIAAERKRQIESEGWTPEHDDSHKDGALALAGVAYAAHAAGRRGTATLYWPWHTDWWKPGTHRRSLMKAAALIVAEIERRDRVSARGLEPQP